MQLLIHALEARLTYQKTMNISPHPLTISGILRVINHVELGVQISEKEILSLHYQRGKDIDPCFKSTINISKNNEYSPTTSYH